MQLADPFERLTALLEAAAAPRADRLKLLEAAHAAWLLLEHDYRRRMRMRDLARAFHQAGATSRAIGLFVDDINPADGMAEVLPVESDAQGWAAFEAALENLADYERARLLGRAAGALGTPAFVQRAGRAIDALPYLIDRVTCALPLLGRLDGAERRRRLDEALEDLPRGGARLLEAILGYLDEDEIIGIAQQIIDDPFPYGRGRARAIELIGHRLSAADRRAFVDALVAAELLEFDVGEIFTACARIDADRREWLLQRALAILERASDDYSIASGLRQLAPELPAAMVDQAIGIAAKVTETNRLEALGALADRDDPASTRAIVEASRGFDELAYRYTLLAQVLPRLPRNERRAELADVAAAATAKGYASKEARLHLLPHAEDAGDPRSFVADLSLVAESGDEEAIVAAIDDVERWWP